MFSSLFPDSSRVQDMAKCFRKGIHLPYSAKDFAKTAPDVKNPICQIDKSGFFHYAGDRTRTGTQETCKGF